VVQAGDNQEAAPGAPVAVPPVFLVKDGQGRPFAGATVAFAVASGGGSIERSSGVSAVDGTVSPGAWTLGPAEGANQLRATMGSLQPTVATAQARHPLVVLVDQAVGPSGATITYSKPGDPLHGLRLEIPAGAYSSPGQWTITYRAATSGPVRPGLVPGGPMVTVKTTQGRAAKLLKLRLPIRTAQDSFPRVYFYDAVADYLEPVPVIAFDATSVTIGTTHFSSAELARPVAASLLGGFAPRRLASAQNDPGLLLGPFVGTLSWLKMNPQGVETPFRPADDGWEFPNHGSYLTPNGQPSGHSISAFSWYSHFSTNGTTSMALSRMFDRIPGPHWPDNPGYRVAALAERDADWMSAGPVLIAMNGTQQYTGMSSDHGQQLLMAYNMLTTHQPQLVAATGPGGGFVALVVIRVSENEIEVMDPNNPASSFNIAFQGGSFQPFTLPSIVGGLSQTYNRIVMVGSTAIVGIVPARLSELFQGKPVGDQEFPAYTIQYHDSDLNVWHTVTSSRLEVPANDLMLRVFCPSCSGHLPVTGTAVPGQTAFDVFDHLGNLLGSDRGAGHVSFQVPAGATKIGVHVLGKCASCGSRWLHVDYRELAINASLISISPNPLVLQPGVQGTLTALNAGNNTPPQVRYDWTFGDGTTAQVTNTNTVQKSYATVGSFDVGVTVTNTANNQVLGRASGRALVGLPVPAWRFTSFKLTLSTFDDIAKSSWGSEAYSKDDEIFRTMQSRPDFGLLVWQPAPVTVGSLPMSAGAYLVYDPTRRATGLDPQYKIRALARPFGWLSVTPDIADKLDFDGLTGSGSVTTGTFGGQAVTATIPFDPARAIVYWTISAAKVGNTISGTMTRIQHLWELPCRLVPIPNPKPGGPTQELKCDPPGTPLEFRGITRHEWSFSATRIQ
jgi:hypothetical protein